MYNHQDGIKAALAAAREGNVLLINRNAALPLSYREKVAYFGRGQNHYLICGTGSGITKPFYYSNIIDYLPDLGIDLDEKVISFYKQFETESPYEGTMQDWAPPTSQKEPLLSEDFVASAASRVNTAIVQINRVSGEGRDVEPGRGEFMLSETELNNLRLLRKNFAKLVIITNISGLMDFGEITDIKPDALLLAWCGGIEGARAVAETLVGAINPSGHLTDTIAKSLEDYPVHQVDAGQNEYSEGLFIGYRHFESNSPDKVLFPFGYGLSYTRFEIEKKCRGAKVTNVGKVAGKCVVQCYVDGRPQDPQRNLVAFAKTPLLEPGESTLISLFNDPQSLAVFDPETRQTVIKKGTYTFYVGENVRDAEPAGTFTQNKDLVVRKGFAEDIPQSEPCDTTLSKEEMIKLVRAEGMDSDRVTPGTASVWGGIADIPEVSSVDGPTGVRLAGNRSDKSVYPCVVAYPTATANASTWNPWIVEECFKECAKELKSFGVDVLLGPGLNIHRYPLCGRNFEYFSEDPLVTGKMAAAVCRGLDKGGATGVLKHYLANNQEFNRLGSTSVVSERVLREIYAKGFEIAIEESPVQAVMTCYNRVNGHWGSCNRPWIQGFLRNELGFDGIVMTDWWAHTDREDGIDVAQPPEEIRGYRDDVNKLIKEGGFMPPLGLQGSFTNLKEMLHAGGDLYMVTSDCKNHEDNLDEASYAELTQAARRIRKFNEWVVSKRA